MANGPLDFSDLGGSQSKSVDATPIDFSDLGGSSPGQAQQAIDFSDLGGTKSFSIQDSIKAALSPFIHVAQDPASILRAASQLGARGGAALGEPVFDPIKQAVEEYGYNAASNVAEKATQLGLPNPVAEGLGVAAGAVPVATGTLMPSSAAEAMLMAIPVAGKAPTVASELARGAAASKAMSEIPSAVGAVVKPAVGAIPSVLARIPPTSEPSALAQWANNQQWYHGSGTSGLNPEIMSTSMTKIEGLLGHGIYITDNPSIAQSYARVRSRTTGTPNVYSLNINTERILDMDQPAIPQIVEIMKSSMPGEISLEISEAAMKQGATLRDVWKAMNKAIEDYSHSNEIPSSEFVENFQELTAKLSESGFDAMRYRGGIQTGGAQHEVLVLLDPRRELTAFNQGGIPGNSVNRPNPILSMTEGVVGKTPVDYAASHAFRLSEREAKLLPEITKASDEELSNMLMKVQRSKESFDKKVPEIETIFGGKLLKTKTQMIDSYAPFEALVGKTQELTGKIVSPEKNPYILVRNYAGISGPINQVYNKLGELLAPTKGLRSEISDYFAAQRDFERAVRGFQNPGGVTDKEALMAIEALKRKMEPQDFAAIENATTAIRDQITNPMIDRLLKSGVINEKGAAALKAKNQMWAPFDIVDHVVDNAENLAYGRRSFQVSSQDVIKSIKGTEKTMRDPMESLVNRIAKVEFLAQRNEVARAMAGLAEKGQTERFVRILKPNEFPGPGYEKMSYFEDGVKKAIAVPKAVAQAAKGMNTQEADFITRGLAGWADVLRKGATVYNVPFAILSNPIRDFKTAMLRSGKGPLFLMDYIKASANAMGIGPYYKMFQEAGGDQGMLAALGYTPKQGLTDIRAAGSITNALMQGGLKGVGRQLSERPKVFGWDSHLLKTIQSPFALVREIGSMIETTPRLAAFKQALAQGKSPTEAAFYARNLTVDFSRSGDAGKVINKIVPFLNARTQGTLNVFSSIKEAPLKSAAILSTTVMMPEIYAYLWNKSRFSDVWKDIPDYEKNNYLIFLKGWKEDEKTGQMVPDGIKIPRGEVDSIFGNALRHFMEFATNDNPMTLGQIALQVGSDISPVTFAQQGKLSPGSFLAQTVPPPIRASIQGVTNRNLGTGLPIIPPDMEGATDKSLLYQQGQTPQTAMLISKWLNSKVSPFMVDQFIRTTMGSYVPYLAEPGTTSKSIINKFIESKGGAEAARTYEKRAAIRGDVVNMDIRFRHFLEDLGDPNKSDAALDGIIDEVTRAAEYGISAKKILNSFNGEIAALEKKGSLDKNTLAFIKMAKDEIARIIAIDEGALPKPPEYPNVTP